jgi:hypothetical protein
MAAKKDEGMNMMWPLLALAGIAYFFFRRQQDVIDAVQANNALPAPAPAPQLEDKTPPPGPTSTPAIPATQVAIDPAPAPVMSRAPLRVSAAVSQTWTPSGAKCLPLMPKHTSPQRAALWQRELHKASREQHSAQLAHRMAQLRSRRMRSPAAYLTPYIHRLRQANLRVRALQSCRPWARKGHVRVV